MHFTIEYTGNSQSILSKVYTVLICNYKHMIIVLITAFRTLYECNIIHHTFRMILVK